MAKSQPVEAMRGAGDTTVRGASARVAATAKLIAGMLAVAAPALLAWATWEAGSPEQVLQSDRIEASQPVLVQPSAIQLSGAVAISVELEIVQQVFFPTPVGGTVTARGESRVVPGATAYWIDDQPVRWFVADAPTTRDLAPGMTGRDIKRAQEFLAGLGYDVGPYDGVAGAKFGQAVRAFNDDSERSGDGSTLAVESLIWSGPNHIGIDAVPQLSVGARVNSGDVLFGGPITSAQASVSELSSPPPESIGAKLTGIYLGTRIWYQQGEVWLSEADALALANAGLEVGDAATVSVALVDPVDTWALPASAVVDHSEVGTCVWVHREGTYTAQPLPIESHRPGVVTSADLDDLTDVVGNPWVLDPAATCGRR